eukprot:TRINITY_DN12681_c0_g1_i2.p1 TRINITY_DN12681_c0_g1~~TRINITY_DN12681_c0_g1_i2.p1  ORF type:complete len:133 (-),score=18.16 TRINITY_DN12681_c0_g1_i2:44-442(-)
MSTPLEIMHRHLEAFNNGRLDLMGPYADQVVYRLLGPNGEIEETTTVTWQEVAPLYQRDINSGVKNRIEEPLTADPPLPDGTVVIHNNLTIAGIRISFTSGIRDGKMVFFEWPRGLAEQHWESDELWKRTRK